MTKKDIAYKILLLIGVGALIPVAIAAPNMLKIAVPLLRKLAKDIDSEPYRVRRSLTAIKENRLVQMKKVGKEYVFTLTEKGRRRILRGELENLKIDIPQKWDGKWRVVIFDIPEKRHRRARNALRYMLKKLGFYQIQKSCFVYPYECRDQIDFICEFFRISEFVNYLVVESLEGEESLQKHFDL